MENLWLIRTAKNVLGGPYTKEQVLDMIKEGTLQAQDEVCRANHYWIYLHERDEVKKQLGIEPPHLRRTRQDGDEITETETETVSAEIQMARESSPPKKPDEEEDEVLLELADVPENDDNTAMLSNRALREFRPPQGSTMASRPTSVSSSAKIVEMNGVRGTRVTDSLADSSPEPASGSRRLLIYALTFAGAILVIALLKLLQG